MIGGTVMGVINPFSYKMTDAYGRPRKVSRVIDACGKGWRRLLLRLVRDLFELGWNGELHQIKEKFGGLRFYIGEYTDEIWNRITAAENESYKTCMACGRTGECRNRRGWLTVLCDGCYKEAYGTDSNDDSV